MLPHRYFMLPQLLFIIVHYSDNWNGFCYLSCKEDKESSEREEPISKTPSTSPGKGVRLLGFNRKLHFLMQLLLIFYIIHLLLILCYFMISLISHIPKL